MIIGELLLAILLLTVAVSSLAALMYSVSHHGGSGDAAKAECVGKMVAGKCDDSQKAATSGVSGRSKLLSSPCSSKTGTRSKECKSASAPSAVAPSEPTETVIRSRTDSASLAKIKKPRHVRTDRGFIR
jgi:hypothetical protein